MPGAEQDRVPVLAGCAFWQQSLRPVRNLRCWGRQGPTADSPAPPQPQLLNHKLPRRKETEPLKQKKKRKGQEGPACLSHRPPWGSMAPRETSKPPTPRTPGHCLTEAPSFFGVWPQLPLQNLLRPQTSISIPRLLHVPHTGPQTAESPALAAPAQAGDWSRHVISVS